MDWEVLIEEGESKTHSFSDKDGGVFVKGLSRFIISDDLQVMPLTTSASFSLFSKLGIMDWSGIEKNIFNLGVGEVLNLLVRSLVSKTPLTETLLKHKPVTELNAGNFDQGKPVEYQMEDEKNIRDGKITIKLMKCSTSLNGCIDHLYKSIQNLDEKCLKSNYHKEMLVSPKLPSSIGYENDLLGIEEASQPPYYYAYKSNRSYFTSDKSLIPSGNDTKITELKVVDPKFHDKDGGGFITGQAIFTVTDSLIISLGLSILNDLKVPFNDIEEQTVVVGKKEALNLLQTCFESESALTNTFSRDLKRANEETKDNMYQKIEKKEDALCDRLQAVTIDKQKSNTITLVDEQPKQSDKDATE
ncbi:uncharacterized protein LOC125420803 isoform X1 [Ziziphus jujuba]|uniref:Uncharacterized protein LOC125420803 isoform X1 n=1 Tax=Ziziphus jujuba TaxID=326968 RepID=A0ABM3I9N6_ZIZJJ|nr:uncharacterized protein LOC125420803 isoform X1 [Ziziphus jujuba]